MSAKHFLGGAAVGAGLVYILDSEGPPAAARYGTRLGDIEGLEAANLSRSRTRADVGGLARAAGAVLAAYGLLRRGRRGAWIRTLGLGIAASAPRRSTPSPTLGERRHTVDIQKSLHVEAPIDRVYAFWTSYDNFPLFMTNVRQVQDLGGGRSRWVVSGPGRRSLQWNAVVTGREENTLLAWHSEPGSIFNNAGAIRFSPEESGTRIDVRFCYSPPTGRAGRAVAEFFGGDPRTRLNQDLERLKTLLETTVRSDSHGQEDPRRTGDR
jgi:uncharacterized membrane protein